MSLNKNLKTRRKQLAILAAVIVGGAAATSGVIWYGQHQQEQKHPAPVATPNMWKGGMADHLNKITRAFWQRSALHGLANERDYPLYLRNYRIFLVYGQPLKRASQTQRVIDDLIQIRNTIRVSLGAARIDSVNVDVNGFLSAVREQMNYRQEQVLTSSGDYNEDEKLNRQVVDQGIGLDVYPSHLRMTLPETIDARGTRLPASAWQPALIAGAWHQWCVENQIQPMAPEKRDEAFPLYLVRLIRNRMEEMNA